VLVVVSAKPPSRAELDAFAAAARAAVDSETPVIVVYRGALDDSAPVFADLRRAVGIPPETTASREALWRRVARLLPAAGPPADSGGEPVPWSTEAFTVLLTDAAKRNDFAFGTALVDVFAHHLGERGAYPAAAARKDLKALRSERQFRLMREYAEAVIAVGTIDDTGASDGRTDATVRRQYGQALIELKHFDQAIDVLAALDADTRGVDEFENHEARGLLGRAWKQRYVDEGGDPDRLRRAIVEYRSVFKENPDERTWQGINAASCLLRAADDGVAPPVPDRPDELSQQVLEILAAREAATPGGLEIWDRATRVEAYVVLGRIAEAEESLRAYLTHPDMSPFEVSSTYRQFDEVLQLRRRGGPAGAILARLQEAATRLRAGGMIGTADTPAKRFLVRVADPDWNPSDVPDLELGARLGTVVSIGGSDHTIEALLRDPLVIAIEESRPAGSPDCERSLKFVHVQPTYEVAGSPFEERGSGALIAIIDDGIDVLHEAFRRDDSGGSRIIGVWDQTDPGPDPAGTVKFGRFHSASEIAGYVAAGVAPAALRDGPHGTHVASIAAGRACGSDFKGGVAPEAELLVVVPKSNEPTGYSDAFIAALEFIDWKAGTRPVVVNVSQGMNAGAHDGKSALEVAFDAFSKGGRTPGRVVVKSAGNERGKRGHATLTVPPGAVDSFTWLCHGRSRPVFLELWWDFNNEYRFRLQAPDGAESAFVDRENQTTTEDFVAGQCQIQLVPAHVDNGDKLLRIMLTCGDAWEEPETWTLTVEAQHVRNAKEIHAWVERDTQPDSYLWPPTEFIDHDTEEMTISVPGTAESVITVGAVDASTPVRVGEFSSFGPTRGADRMRPDICAPGVGVIAAEAGSDNGVVAMDGTSMAAPHVTGAVALLLSRAAATGKELSATRIRSLLRRNTLYDNGYWDRGQGFGVLDVQKLLEVGLPTQI
jgi:endonuclease G